MHGPKITLVGAASLVFSMTIINDLSLEDDLEGLELTLLDVNRDGLDLVENLARRLAKLRGNVMQVTATTDRAAALDGADFVINAAAIGERDLWPQEREVARQFGYWPSKGFRMSGLRNTPLTLSIAESMEKYCPDAWLLQHGNPMVANIGAVSRYTNINVAGFCHGVGGTVDDLAKWMGIDKARLDVEAVGINHFLFITKWYCDGRDAYESLLQWVERDFSKIWDTDEWKSGTDIPGPVSQDLCRRFGAFPCNGDEHMSDYFNWYTRTPELREHFRAKTDYLDRHIARGNARWETWLKLAGAPDGEVARAFERSSGEATTAVVQALRLADRTYVGHLNLPNHGAVGGLPYDSALEMPAIVTTDAIRPIGDQYLAPGTEAHIARRLAEEELQMRASLEKSRELVYRAMELNPYTVSQEQMTGCVAGFAEVNREYLPWLS